MLQKNVSALNIVESRSKEMWLLACVTLMINSFLFLGVSTPKLSIIIILLTDQPKYSSNCPYFRLRADEHIESKRDLLPL